MKEMILSDSRADVWIVSLDRLDEERRADCRSVLTVAELERLRRFLLPEPQDEFLVSRALLRTVLTRYTDVPEGDWVFERDSHGKPYVAEPLGFRRLGFNLSHGAGLIALIVSGIPEVGVDVEGIERAVDARAIASRFFAPSEAAKIDAAPPERLLSVFLSFWTLKEAYIKARGMGLAIPLNSFAFDVDVATGPMLCTDGDTNCGKNWRFHLFRPTPRHQAAIAVALNGRGRIALVVRRVAIPPLVEVEVVDHLVLRR